VTEMFTDGELKEILTTKNLIAWYFWIDFL
jgi:hypothetical protein